MRCATGPVGRLPALDRIGAVEEPDIEATGPTDKSCDISPVLSDDCLAVCVRRYVSPHFDGVALVAQFSPKFCPQDLSVEPVSLGLTIPTSRP